MVITHFCLFLKISRDFADFETNLLEGFNVIHP